MGKLLRRIAPLGAVGQAVHFHARERRRSLAAVPELFRTHLIRGASAMAVAPIDTDVAFPNRDIPITFASAILVTANAGSHKGLVFELGSATQGVALWIEDDKIGFHAGAAGTVNGASAIFDYGTEIPPGLELDIVVAIQPGSGRVRLWGNAKELARGTASGGGFTGGDWADTEDGSFAADESGTVVTDVPAGSQQAPSGFTVIKPLSVYVNQVPRHFA